jgi:hypothetical protein
MVFVESERQRPLHRGRTQAQGGGVEKSASWAQATPLTVRQRLLQLRLLAAQLTPTECRARALGLMRARHFMRNAAAGGGVGPTKVAFPAGQPIRIDIKVSAGMAFVPD